ncbi:hypothetical protein [Halosolutus halophilus]|uniref:hypothetical protein n=1 Tax=Halosolutus halophilus TaxID=1552990 RepID=UPI0022352EE3|nr:hypothetical protein [Halosolutus halophilus]
MSAEVDWVLDQLGSVVDGVGTDYTLRDGDPVTIKRINRDDSGVYEGSSGVDMTEPIHTRTEDLEGGIFIGAKLADWDTDPVGTEYDHQIEAIVGLTIEGLTTRGGNYGHVDPDGQNGVPFDELTRRVRRTLLASRSYPNPGVPNTSYNDLLVTNDDPQSAEYRDFYRYQVDCVFRGYEELP